MTVAVLRRAALLAVLALLCLGFAGCPRQGEQRGDDILAFAAGGELRPRTTEGEHIFGDRKGGHPLVTMIPHLVERDLVMVDLAGGLDIGCQPLIREQIFRWQPDWLQYLSEANIRVLNLADDHCLDCGRDALAHATSQMLAQGFYVCGAGVDQEEAHAPVYLTRYGITVSIVSFLMESPPAIAPCEECTGPSIYSRQALISSLKEMKKRAMHHLAVFHWKERDLPGLTDDELSVAKEAMDFGADLVIGYGPRSAGGLYRIRGRWVIGSLGRLSGTPASSESKIVDGLLLAAEFTRGNMMNLRVLPVTLEKGRPRVMRGQEGAAALRALMATSDQMVADNSSLIGDILYLK